MSSIKKIITKNWKIFIRNEKNPKIRIIAKPIKIGEKTKFPKIGRNLKNKLQIPRNI